MKRLLRVTTVVTTAFAVALAACGPPSDGYDVVILNGRVMDPETGFDAVTNVGIVELPSRGIKFQVDQDDKHADHDADRGS